MPAMSPGVISAEFLYDEAPFPSCHAATIVETRAGSLLAAFFGGTKERDPDVCIYLCRRVGDGKWSEPVNVADGVQDDGRREPTWNPVLFQPRGGPIMLFYKVGPSPAKWWGMVRTSDDDGRTWSAPQRLPAGILGPIKNKPVQLAGEGDRGGDILCPTSVESPQLGWRVCFERSSDGGRTWTSSMFVEQDADVKAIQPSILLHSPTKLQAIGRTRSGRLFETWSSDAGQTWSKLALTQLPNCNSGTDAVTLRDGRLVLAYNHSNVEKVRTPLNLAVSDDGRVWKSAAVLEDEPTGQYSYPAVIQSSDGLIHVVYTWKRLRIKHAVIDPNRLELRAMAVPAGAHR
jgi:predicted neuraminidase